MPFEVKNYLHAMTRKLHLESSEKYEILKELEGHVEDKAAELQLKGLDHETAMTRAVEEMGSLNTVARRLHEIHSPGLWRDAMLATIPHFLLAALFALHLWSHYFLDINYHRSAAIQCCSFFSPHRVCSIFYVDYGQRIIQDG